ncbi:MAG: glucose 1-dehydrogenase [Deltaproteobacteria bacterium]|jgi:NAD(P)-dependent dehydrogenase (short-subunit alcohol dehydrogenase family)|nr:glucose 1-dehydrogenase [Deltaproteobacteria bacterium]MBW2534077.1 glucose 1-dehydrogenase [Deltaproteobacteria bacterium]
MLLEEKGAIVTGATSGIGMATVRRFVAEGASVLAVGRDRSVLSELAESVSDQPGYVAPCAADVVDGAAPARIVDAALEAFAGVDVLVNAAGIIGTGTVESTSDEQWDRMLDVNLRAPFRLLREVVPHLQKRGGAVVNVSSVTGLRAFPGVLAYCVSKSGIDQLTRCAALELAPMGVRVNAVNPGVVVTNLHRRSGFSEQQYADFLEHSRTTHPLGRAGEPEEIADLILFLASGRSGWVTGETIAIDGGRHLTCAR